MMILNNDHKTGINVVTSLMALCATTLGIAACVLNENYRIDDYIYISIYGMEGIFLLSKSIILYNNIYMIFVSENKDLFILRRGMKCSRTGYVWAFHRDRPILKVAFKMVPACTI